MSERNDHLTIDPRFAAALGKSEVQIKRMGLRELCEEASRKGLRLRISQFHPAPDGIERGLVCTVADGGQKASSP